MARRPALALAVAACTLGLGATTADAHGGASHKLTERQIQRIETRLLGPQHAREHAAERRALRRAARSGRRRSFKVPPLAHAAADPPPKEVGRWEGTTFNLPTWAINAVLMPTGKVLFWGRSPLDQMGHRGNESPAYMLDPQTGATTEVEPPYIDIDLDGDGDLDRAPLFCSGQSLLPSGEVLVTGGNLANPTSLGGSTPAPRGLNRVFTFDPWTLSWTEQPPLHHGRWYPTQVLLPDGRTAVLAGADENGNGTNNQEMELFTPPAQRGGRGGITRAPAGDRNSGLYPHLIVVADGSVLMAGPERVDSALLDTAALGGSATGSAWKPLPPTVSTFHGGGNGLLLPNGPGGSLRAALLGGWIFDQNTATNIVETIDLSDPNPEWSRGQLPDLNLGRMYGNTVQLPDESLVQVGGGAGSHSPDGINWTGGDEDLKKVELLRPGLDSAWRLGPAQRKWRSYHSTALLLPDGRVLSMGDDYWDPGTMPDPGGGSTADRDLAEIYSPPYLFSSNGQLAPRPEISSAPDVVRYGEPFAIGVSGQPGARAVLAAPGATTHGNDMNQRIVPLELVGAPSASGLTVRAPASGNLAPPGYYMLFVLDANGTPSVARFVQVLPPGAAPPATPPAGAPGGAPAPSAIDRRKPRITLNLGNVKPRGGKIRIRLTLDEPGSAVVRLRAGSRHTTRRLTLKARAGRTVTLRVRRGHSRTQRLRVTISARDLAGNAATLRKTWRIRFR